MRHEFGGTSFLPMESLHGKPVETVATAVVGALTDALAKVDYIVDAYCLTLESVRLTSWVQRVSENGGDPYDALGLRVEVVANTEEVKG